MPTEYVLHTIAHLDLIHETAVDTCLYRMKRKSAGFAARRRPDVGFAEKKCAEKSFFLIQKPGKIRGGCGLLGMFNYDSTLFYA